MSGTRTLDRYEIVPATMAHVYALAANLRDGDRREMEDVGVDPRQGLRSTYRGAILRKTALIDGEVAAMWGICGDLISETGTPWLMTTPRIEKMPKAFIREAKAELAGMLRMRRHLKNWVAADYKGAIRLLQVLGFTVHEPEPFGPKGALFRMFEARATDGI